MSKNKNNNQKITKQVSDYGQINEEIKKIIPPAPNIYNNSDNYQTPNQQ